MYTLLLNVTPFACKNTNRDPRVKRELRLVDVIYD